MTILISVIVVMSLLGLAAAVDVALALRDARRGARRDDSAP